MYKTSLKEIKHKLYPKYSRKCQKLAFYDVIMGSKSNFVKQIFFSKLISKNVLHDRLGYFFNFKVNGLKNAKNSNFLRFSHSPYIKSLSYD